MADIRVREKIKDLIQIHMKILFLLIFKEDKVVILVITCENMTNFRAKLTTGTMEEERDVTRIHS